MVGRAERPRGTVLLLHGQGADALANAKELALLCGAGFDVVGVDAPEHGRRFDPERDARWESDRIGALQQHIHTAGAEIPAILDACEQAGLARPFGITGISLGGFSLWEGMRLDARVRFGIPILGSPTIPGALDPDPALWSGRAVLAINAEQDEVVPLEPTRRLVTAMDGQLQVIPDCPHRVPELQWWAIWGQVLAWLGQLPGHADERDSPRV